MHRDRLGMMYGVVQERCYTAYAHGEEMDDHMYPSLLRRSLFADVVNSPDLSCHSRVCIDFTSILITVLLLFSTRITASPSNGLDYSHHRL